MLRFLGAHLRPSFFTDALMFPNLIELVCWKVRKVPSSFVFQPCWRKLESAALFTRPCADSPASSASTQLTSMFKMKSHWWACIMWHFGGGSLSLAIHTFTKRECDSVVSLQISNFCCGRCCPACLTLAYSCWNTDHISKYWSRTSPPYFFTGSDKFLVVFTVFWKIFIPHLWSLWAFQRVWEEAGHMYQNLWSHPVINYLSFQAQIPR